MLAETSTHATRAPQPLASVPLVFRLPEAHEWAEFSGDFNPIHFDLQRARSAGLDGLVVHRMRALLPIKQIMCRLAAEKTPAYDTPASTAEWTKFHAVFRKPIPYGSTSLLTLRNAKNARIDFRLNTRDTADERIRGSLGPAHSQADWLDAHPWEGQTFHAIEPDAIQRFAQTYPSVSEAWIALDACIFSDFIRHRLDAIAEVVRRQFPPLSGPSGAGELFVQVSHTVFFDDHALQSLVPGQAGHPPLSYAMSPPQVVASPDKLAGSVSLPVRLAGSVVMLVEIGLLARPAQAHSQLKSSAHHEHHPIPS